LRRRTAEFVESCDRGIEVCLIEKFTTAYQFAINRQDLDDLPLGFKALWRGPT
jgi:hypothetical protein